MSSLTSVLRQQGIQYAEVTPLESEDVRGKFIDEYSLGEGSTLRVVPVMSRLRELLRTDRAIRDAVSAKQKEKELDREVESLRRENAMKNIEVIRQAIEKASTDKIYSYEATGEIIGHLARMNVSEAETMLKTLIKDQAELDSCLETMAQITGSRRIETDYELKLIRLSSAYQCIHQAANTLKTINMDTPQHLLQAQVTLLNAAIARNDASFLGNVLYLLQDFCASLAEIITQGWWEPEFKRIEAIQEKLKERPCDVVTREDYQEELKSVQLLLDSKETLKSEAGIHFNP